MPTAPNIKAYAEVIGRIAQALSLASLIPVAWELRFSAKARGSFLNQGINKTRPEDAKEKGRQEKTPAPVTKKVILPLGMLSVLLFLASEVVVCQDVFKSSPKFIRKMENIRDAELKLQEDYMKKSEGKGKPKKFKHEPVYPEGPIGALLKGIGEGYKKSAKNPAMFDSFALTVTSALESPLAFATAHGIVMMIGLVTVLLTMITHICWNGDVRIWQAFQCVILVIPVLLFAMCRWETFMKIWKIFDTTKNLLPAFSLPLRTLGLIAATPPPEDDESPSTQSGVAPWQGQMGTPAWFSCLQAASLAALLSSEIAKGEMPKAMEAFSRKPVSVAIFDSTVVAVMVPVLLTLLWITVMHLRKAPGAMLVTTFLVGITTPAVLAQFWPKAALLIGPVAGTKDAVGILLAIVSIAYSLFGFSVIITSGTMGIMGTLAIGQLLLWIHGEDVVKLFMPPQYQ